VRSVGRLEHHAAGRAGRAPPAVESRLRAAGRRGRAGPRARLGGRQGSSTVLHSATRPLRPLRARRRRRAGGSSPRSRRAASTIGRLAEGKLDHRHPPPPWRPAARARSPGAVQVPQTRAGVGEADFRPRPLPGPLPVSAPRCEVSPWAARGCVRARGRRARRASRRSRQRCRTRGTCAPRCPLRLDVKLSASPNRRVQIEVPLRQPSSSRRAPRLGLPEARRAARRRAGHRPDRGLVFAGADQRRDGVQGIEEEVRPQLRLERVQPCFRSPSPDGGSGGSTGGRARWRRSPRSRAVDEEQIGGVAQHRRGGMPAPA